MVTCVKCDYAYDAGSAPGGQCPRCLLLGVHEDEMDVEPENDTAPTPPTTDKNSSAHSLEIDELAAELPGFELEEQIGRGGMGVVWRARERLLDRHVAIKLLRNVDNDPVFVERFTREARVMARLNHPNVVTLYTFGRTRSNHCYMVMELIDGMDLAQAMARHQVSVPTALAIVSDVCDALEAAHRAGFVHRDMKPGNVLLDKSGHIKVVDFGLARLARPLDPTTLSITKHGHAVGTPQYIAPEQARGRGNEDHRADIYSLGVMLYEMLTGELPRGIFKPPSQKLKLSRQIDRIIVRALQEDPAQRYQDIATLKADVRKVRKKIDPQLIAQRHDAQYDTRWRRRGEMLLATAVALFLGIMCAWYAREWLDPRPLKPSRPPLLASPVVAGNGVTSRTLQGLSLGGGLTIANEVRLQPADLPPGSGFGRQIAAWESWLAVAAHDVPQSSANARGAIFMYHRMPDGTWQLRQQLQPPQPGLAVYFGSALALHDGTLVVGSAPQQRQGDTALELFEWNPDRQEWRAKPSPALKSEQGFRLSMTSLSLHGQRLATLGISPSNQRCVVVFDRQPDGSWKEQAIYPESGIPTGRCVVANDGRVYSALTSVERESDGSLCGGLLIAWQKAGVWHTRTLPCPPDPAILATSFFSVSAGGEHVLLGAYRMQAQEGLGWVLQTGPEGRAESQGYLTPHAGGGASEFGKSVLQADGWLAVGADHQHVDARHRGAVHFYRRNTAPEDWVWTATLPASAATGANDFGNSLALGDGFLAVGAPRSYAKGNENADEDDAPGAVFVYQVMSQGP
jgi:serine/threonine protein kinase